VPERFRERLFDFLDNNCDGELDLEEEAAGRRSLEAIMETKPLRCPSLCFPLQSLSTNVGNNSTQQKAAQQKTAQYDASKKEGPLMYVGIEIENRFG